MSKRLFGRVVLYQNTSNLGNNLYHQLSYIERRKSLKTCKKDSNLNFHLHASYDRRMQFHETGFFSNNAPKYFDFIPFLLHKE